MPNSTSTTSTSDLKTRLARLTENLKHDPITAKLFANKQQQQFFSPPSTTAATNDQNQNQHVSSSSENYSQQQQQRLSPSPSRPTFPTTSARRATISPSPTERLVAHVKRSDLFPHKKKKPTVKDIVFKYLHEKKEREEEEEEEQERSRERENEKAKSGSRQRKTTPESNRNNDDDDEEDDEGLVVVTPRNNNNNDKIVGQSLDGKTSIRGRDRKDLHIKFDDDLQETSIKTPNNISITTAAETSTNKVAGSSTTNSNRVPTVAILVGDDDDGQDNNSSSSSQHHQPQQQQQQHSSSTSSSLMRNSMKDRPLIQLDSSTLLRASNTNSDDRDFASINILPFGASSSQSAAPRASASVVAGAGFPTANASITNQRSFRRLHSASVVFNQSHSVNPNLYNIHFGASLRNNMMQEQQQQKQQQNKNSKLKSKNGSDADTHGFGFSTTAMINQSTGLAVEDDSSTLIHPPNDYYLLDENTNQAMEEPQVAVNLQSDRRARLLSTMSWRHSHSRLDAQVLSIIHSIAHDAPAKE